MNPDPWAMRPAPLPHQAEPASRSPRLLWLAAFTTIAALTAARLPAVRAEVERRVQTALASGELADTTQRELAVNLGVAAALALSLTFTLVVLAVARRAESRLRLPAVTVRGLPVSGTLLVVWAVLGAKQGASLVSASTQPLTDPWVWGAVLAAGVGVAVAVGRHAGSRRALARTVATAGLVGIVALAV
jgi:hypothetical protein